MKQLLSFMAILCLPFAPLFAQQDSSYMCPGDTTDLTFHGLSFPSFEEPETINFQTDGLLWMTQEGGTATLTGNFIQGGHPENGFTADILFVNKMNWEEWSGQFTPTSYMNDEGAITDEYLDWMYYIMDGNNSTLSGFGIYDGTELQLSHAPISGYYAYQVGVGANQQVPLTDGQGGWALVQGTFVNAETGVSDLEFQSSINIYLTYGCEPNAQTVETPEPPSLEFSLFPNPATFWIGVQFEVQKAAESATYLILDSQGKIVMQDQLIGPRIDVSDLPAGNYSLSVKQDETIGKRQFVKL